MRLNYKTFTGRRSTFVCVAACLILLSWAAFAVCLPDVTILLSQHLNLKGNRLSAAILFIQNALVVLSVLIAALVTERDRSMKEKFGLTIDPGYSLRFLFPVFVIAVLATIGAEIGLTSLLKALGREAQPQSLVDSFRTMKPLTFIVFALFPVVAAPIAEELAFRHILYRFVRVFLYRKEAAVVVSLLFALCHVSLATVIKTKPFPWEMLVVPVVPLFILAIFLQWQYEKSKSVIPSMLIHAGFNLISVLLLALEVFVAPPPEQREPLDVAKAQPVVEEAPAAESSAPVDQPAAEAPAAESSAPAVLPVQAVFLSDYNG